MVSKRADIFEIMKSVKIANIDTILKELDHPKYRNPWLSKEITQESIKTNIRRELRSLEELGLVLITKYQGINQYRLKNYILVDKASELIYELEVLMENDETIPRVEKILSDLSKEINSSYYIKQNIENLDNKVEIIDQLLTAITEKKYIELSYKNKLYIVKSMKIVEFEGIWYLIAYLKNEAYRVFSISAIESVLVMDEVFHLSTKQKNIYIEDWNNIWHDPTKKETRLRLFIHNEKLIYFKKKNIFNIEKFPNRVKKCLDGIEYDIYITHPMEVLSELMYWMPHVFIIEEDGNLNVTQQLNNILKEMLAKQSIL